MDLGTGGRRGLTFPERVDEPLGRDDMIGLEQQERKDDALAAALDDHRLPAVLDGERSEYSEIKPHENPITESVSPKSDVRAGAGNHAVNYT
ncbi:hypothetical protein OHR68_20290 [Spirillospora sp. NBC_00431]